MADTKKKVIIEVLLDDKAKAGFSQLKQSVGNFAKVAAIATGAATALGAVVVKSIADYEKLEKTFTSLTGSMAGAKALLHDIQIISQASPFELDELNAMAQQILAYGFAIEEVIPLMESLGDISAALGDDVFERLVRALGQVQAKGKLMGQELLQLAETGLPVAQALADKFGISVQDLSQNLDKLNISFEDVQDTVMQLSEDKYAGLMAEQAGTLAGAWNVIKNNIKIAAIQVGMFSGALETSKSVTDAILKSIEQLKKVALVVVLALRAVVEGGLRMFNTFKALVPVLIGVAGALVAVVTVLMAMKVISSVTLLVSGLTGALGALASPILLVTALLGALLAVLGYTYIKNIQINDSIGKITTGFPRMGSAGKAANNAIADSAGQAAESIENIKKQIEAENKAYEEQLATIVRNARERIKANKEALAEEKKLFEEEQAERDKGYEEEKGEIEESTEDKIKSLEEYYRQTEQLDDENKDERLQQILRAIEEERAAGEEKLAKLKEQYDQENQAAKESFEEKTSALQEQLDKDMQMLEKHSEDIKKIKIGEAKDEIEILKEKHEERLTELQEQLEKEKGEHAKANDFMVDDFGASIGDMNKILGDFEAGLDWDDIFEMPSFKDMIENWAEILRDNLAMMGENIRDFFSLESLFPNWRRAGGGSGGGGWGDRSATGGAVSGGWTMVGERGAELVNLPRGSHVYNKEDTNRMMGGGDIVINVNAPVTGVDNLKATILEAVNEATARQNRLANYNLL